MAKTNRHRLSEVKALKKRMVVMEKRKKELQDEIERKNQMIQIPEDEERPNTNANAKERR